MLRPDRSGQPIVNGLVEVVMATRQVRMPKAPQWGGRQFPSEQPESAPAPPPRDPPSWPVAATAIAVAVVMAGLVAWVVLSRPTSATAGDLAVGDCANDVAFDGTTVDSVATADCAELHEVEVFATTVVRGEGPWPGDREVDARAARACQTAASGELTTLDPGWQLKFLRPTSDGWAVGDRAVVCFVTRASGNLTAGSVIR